MTRRKLINEFQEGMDRFPYVLNEEDLTNLIGAMVEQNDPKYTKEFTEFYQWLETLPREASFKVDEFIGYTKATFGDQGLAVGIALGLVCGEKVSGIVDLYKKMQALRGKVE